MSSIEPDFEYVASMSPFLRSHAGDDNCSKGIALFHRCEIIIGERLGTGGFSEVFEITAFELSNAVSAQCTPQEQTLRERYVANVLGNDGFSRFCIKQLQERMIQSPKDFQCAASDLAVEAAFMSALDHDNILSLRGLPTNGLKAWEDGQHDSYFIIVDRLHETLEGRIQDWQSSKAPSVTERAEFALQLATALRYLHANRIVFRDLKPQNIGFTADNQVKLFDFGLCRELPHGVHSSSEVYEMSGVGTTRYMAPEVINDAKYNLKTDVYGWSMIFWEVLSLSKPYAPYSSDDHRREVCRKGERPSLLLQWPPWIHNLLRLSWEEDVESRLTMNDVCNYLQAALTAEKENLSNNELRFTNHDNVSSKNFAMPNSPTAIADFPEPMVLATTSIDAESIDHFSDLYEYEDAPPPAPRRMPAYLTLPEIVVRNIALSIRGDDDGDEKVPGLYNPSSTRVLPGT